MNYLIVFIGAGIGGALRHGVNNVSARLLGTGFPWGTLTVNIVGSLAMGLLAGYFAFKGEAAQAWLADEPFTRAGGYASSSSHAFVNLWPQKAGFAPAA